MKMEVLIEIMKFVVEFEDTVILTLYELIEVGELVITTAPKQLETKIKECRRTPVR